MRLIDADLIETKLRYRELLKDEKVTWLEAYRKFLDIIENATTAYDTDVVVKLMQKEAEQYDNPVANSGDFRNFCKGIAAGYRYAIEIVKAGGIDE